MHGISVDIEDGSKEIFTTALPESPHRQKLADISKMEESYDMGYDLDEEIGLFDDAIVLEGVQDFDKIRVGERPINASTDALDSNPPPFQPPSRHIPISEECLKDLKSAELKNELKIRKQSMLGKKSDLLKRLKFALKNMVQVDPILLESTAGPVFHPGAYWEVLKCDEEVVDTSAGDQ